MDIQEDIVLKLILTRLCFHRILILHLASQNLTFFITFFF